MTFVTLPQTEKAASDHVLHYHIAMRGVGGGRYPGTRFASWQELHDNEHANNYAPIVPHRHTLEED